MLGDVLAGILDFAASAAIVTMALCGWFGYRNEGAPPFRQHFAGLYPWACAWLAAALALRWAGLPPWAAVPISAALVVLVATWGLIVTDQRDREGR